MIVDETHMDHKPSAAERYAADATQSRERKDEKMAYNPQRSKKPQRKRRPATGAFATQPNTPFNANGAGTDNGSLTGGVLGVGAGEIQVNGYTSISQVIPSINSITVVVDSGPTY